MKAGHQMKFALEGEELNFFAEVELIFFDVGVSLMPVFCHKGCGVRIFFTEDVNLKAHLDAIKSKHLSKLPASQNAKLGSCLYFPVRGSVFAFHVEYIKD